MKERRTFLLRIILDPCANNVNTTTALTELHTHDLIIYNLTDRKISCVVLTTRQRDARFCFYFT